MPYMLTQLETSASFKYIAEPEGNHQDYQTLRGSLRSSYSILKDSPGVHTQGHSLVGMSCDLIPDHHIFHKPFGIQPRIIMANLHSGELPQVLALRE